MACACKFVLYAYTISFGAICYVCVWNWWQKLLKGSFIMRIENKKKLCPNSPLPKVVTYNWTNWNHWLFLALLHYIVFINPQLFSPPFVWVGGISCQILCGTAACMYRISLGLLLAKHLWLSLLIDVSFCLACLGTDTSSLYPPPGD